MWLVWRDPRVRREEMIPCPSAAPAAVALPGCVVNPAATWSHETFAGDAAAATAFAWPAPAPTLTLASGTVHWLIIWRRWPKLLFHELAEEMMWTMVSTAIVFIAFGVRPANNLLAVIFSGALALLK